MGGIRVAAEHTAGDQHLDGGLHPVHGADLAVGGLGAQQKILGQIKSILHIPGGVILGHIQAGEVVVVIVDLRGIAHLKAHTCKGIDDLVFHQRDGVQRALRANFGGHGDVHRFGGVAGVHFGAAHLLGGLVILGLHLLLELVDDLTGGGALGGRHIAQLFHKAGHLAVFAQVFLPKGRKRFAAVHSGKALLYLGGKFVDHILHNSCSFQKLAGKAGALSLFLKK